MCSLCGVLGVEDHWTDAVARPDVFTRNDAAHRRRLERAARIDVANAILRARRLTLRDWQGSSYVLSTATGKTEVVESLAHLWPTAERLSGCAFDPLDPVLMRAMADEA